MRKSQIIISKIPKDADIMTLKQFIETCKTYGFVDSDGHGYYSVDGKTMINIMATPSDVRAGNIQDNYSYVVWFNK